MSRFELLLGRRMVKAGEPRPERSPKIPGWTGLTVRELIGMVPWHRWRSGCPIRIKMDGSGYGALQAAVETDEAIVLVQTEKSLGCILDSRRIHSMLRATEPDKCIACATSSGLMGDQLVHPVLGWNVTAGFWGTKHMDAIISTKIMSQLRSPSANIPPSRSAGESSDG